MRKNLLRAMCIALLGAVLLTACSKENKLEQPSAETPSGGTEENPSGSDNSGEVTYLDGYARPEGVMILNQGARRLENSSLTYLAPDGTVEEHVYRGVNGTAFGNEAQGLWMYNGKLYIISNGIYAPKGEEADGILVIADAVTLKREKVFRMDDLKFKRPPGCLDPEGWMPMHTPFDNVAVLDEQNIFFSEGQALFRFDSTTGEVNIVEGAYHFGNQGNTIENVASTTGVIRVGDCLYCAGGGFWESTRLIELSKGMNKVSRVLPDLKGQFISGICQTGEREIMLATCGRGGEKNSYLLFVNLDEWKIVKEKKISEDISAEFFNNSGVSLAGDYLYYAAGSTTVRRLSLKTWKSEVFIDASKDAPDAPHLNCNVVADPSTQYVYVAVSNAYSEMETPDKNYLLVYDCSGTSPVLVKKLVNQTCYPVGIFFMREFYK